MPMIYEDAERGWRYDLSDQHDVERLRGERIRQVVLLRMLSPSLGLKEAKDLADGVPFDLLIKILREEIPIPREWISAITELADLRYRVTVYENRAKDAIAQTEQFQRSNEILVEQVQHLRIELVQQQEISANLRDSVDFLKELNELHKRHIERLRARQRGNAWEE